MPASGAMRLVFTPALIASLLSVAAPATAEPASDVAAERGTAVRLRDCFLTVAFVPRPQSVLQSVFRDPLEIDATFYGPDPLLGVWGMSCERSRVAGEPAGEVVASLVGVAVGLTDANSAPLANNFAHRLIRIDTTSRKLVRAARRADLPATRSRRARYEHSGGGAVASQGELRVPGKYAVDVSASSLDPTNPHDHANLFEPHSGRTAALSLSIANAFDRFCFPPNADCSASVRAPRGSMLAGLLGGRSAPVRAAFDHDKLARVKLQLSGP